MLNRYTQLTLAASSLQYQLIQRLLLPVTATIHVVFTGVAARSCRRGKLSYILPAL